MAELSKTDRQLLELQHLASELAASTHAHLKAERTGEVVRVQAELAATFASKLLAHGPLMFHACLDNAAPVPVYAWRSAGGLLVEVVVCHYATNQGRVYLADLRDVYLFDWKLLGIATSCTDADFYVAAEQARAGGKQVALHVAPHLAPIAESEGREVGIEVKASTAPSSVGRARYETVLWVGAWMVDAFRSALADWGGLVLEEKPAVFNNVGDGFSFTVSLVEINDMFQIGKQMVLEHCAAKSMGGPAA